MEDASEVSALQEVTGLYRKILELTLRQETCLRDGTFGALSAILAEKAAIVADTDLLLGTLSRAVDRGSETFQQGLKQLTTLVSDVLAAEERCRKLAPPRPPAPPRRVISAYAASGTAPEAHPTR